MDENGYENDIRHPDFAPDRGLSRNERLVMTGLLGTMIAATILGNLLVILSFLTDRRLWVFQNWFILSLGVADGLVGAAVMPLTLIYELTGRWEFGSTLCKVWQYLDAVCCSSSILNLCAISVARYWSVAKPFQYALHLQTSNRAGLVILVVWCVALTANLPLLVGWAWDDSPPPGPLQCQIVDHVGLNVYSTLVTFFVPVAIMIIVTVATGNTMRRRRKRVHVSGAAVLRAVEATSRPAFTRASAHQQGQSVMTDREQQHHHHQAVLRTPPKAGMPVILKSTELGVRIIEPESPPRPNSTDPDIGDGAFPPSPTGNGIGVAAAAEVAMEMQTLKVKQRSNVGLLRQYGSCSSGEDLLRQPAASSTTVTKPSTSFQRALRTPRATSGTPSTTPTSSSRTSAQSAAASARSNNRLMRMLAVVIVFFIVCWSPFYIIYLVRPLCASCDVHPDLITMSIWLGYFNSTLNPALYAAMSKHFRRDFKRILTLQFLWKKR